VRVLAIWQPMLPTDFFQPSRGTLARLADARAIQAWDKDRVVARQMDKDARAPQPKPECCRRDDVLWDLAAVYPPGAVWSASMPPAVFFDGSVVGVRDGLESSLRRVIGGGTN